MRVKRGQLLTYVLIIEIFMISFNIASIMIKNQDGKADSTMSAEPLFSIDVPATLVKDVVSFPTLSEMIEATHSDLTYVAKIEEEGTLMYSSRSGAYRYGPSIISNPDGTIDAWFSAPGNNSTEWDYISYRHYEDGKWGAEKIVLKPTRNSADRCSCCDPGVIYFNDYYYLAYTSTWDAKRKGMNNSAFVARSHDPEGPYEKWNGDGWGGNPIPIIEYEDDPNGWGIGEVSFVIKDNELYIYYTYFDTTGGSTRLAKARLSENWPNTIKEEGIACPRRHNDSIDVVYCDELNNFLAFAIDYRMDSASRLIVYESADGAEFSKVGTRKDGIEDYAHNLGISKDPQGHISLTDDLIIGYAYGRSWGRWSAVFKNMELDVRPDSSFHF